MVQEVADTLIDLVHRVAISLFPLSLTNNDYRDQESQCDHKLVLWTTAVSAGYTKTAISISIFLFSS